MRIAFRCDASPAIGGGHVMRCLTLAGEFSRRGHNVLFVCAAGAAESAPALARSGVPVVAPAEFHVAVDWLVADSYALAAPQERAFRPQAARILVIDDLANRPHDCDLLLDQNAGRRASAYDGLVPPRACVLAGPRHALLRPEFRAARPSSLARRAAPGRRILVSLGLTDVGGITGAVVDALRSLDAAVDVVVGRRAQSLAALQERAARDPRLALHIDTDSVADLMARADLAVGAGGTSSWERCCLGLPTLVLTLADNQVEVAKNLVAAGAARLVGRDDLAGLAAAAGALLDDQAALAAMSAAAAALCDGCGAARVAEAMLSMALGRAS